MIVSHIGACYFCHEYISSPSLPIFYCIRYAPTLRASCDTLPFQFKRRVTRIVRNSVRVSSAIREVRYDRE